MITEGLSLPLKLILILPLPSSPDKVLGLASGFSKPTEVAFGRPR